MPNSDPVQASVNGGLKRHPDVTFGMSEMALAHWIMAGIGTGIWGLSFGVLVYLRNKHDLTPEERERRKAAMRKNARNIWWWLGLTNEPARPGSVLDPNRIRPPGPF